MPTPRTETETGTGRDNRFDPFLLPTATAIRFSLIIMVAAVGSMYLGVWYVVLGSVLEPDLLEGEGLSVCASQARADVGHLADQAVFDGFTGCVTALRWRFLLWMVVLGPVWACLTVLVYAIYPVILRWRLRPVQLPQDRGVRAARLEMDTALAGVRGRVELLTTPGTAGGARVFGAFGRYQMAVDTSLLASGGSGGLDERALAVIRHEAAHLRNRDVDMTYLTMSSWWAFLVLTSLPLVAYTLTALVVVATGSPLNSLGDPGASLAVSVLALLLLQAARARVLRTREHYADVLAASTGRTGEELRLLLSRPRLPRAPRWRRWYRRYHPSHRSRLDMLNDPRRLTAVSGVDLAIAGVALGAAHLHLVNTYALVAPETMGTPTFVLLAAPVGALVTAIVWNAVHAAPAGTPSWRAAAAALSGGVLIGLSPPNVVGNMWVDLLLDHPLRALASALALWGICLLFLRWAALSARTWLAAAGRERAVSVAGMVCGAVVFGCAFGLWERFNGKLSNASAEGWIVAWNALSTTGTAWTLPAAVGCAAVFVFTGLVRRSRVYGPARRPLVPIVAACVLAAGHMGLMSGAIVLGARSGRALTDALLGSVLLLTVVLTVAVSVGLGVWSGGRGRQGAALSTTTVFVLALLALQPAAFWVGIQGTVCLASPSPGCWGTVSGGMLTSYSNALLIFVGLAGFLIVCGVGATVGSRIGAMTQRGRRPADTPGAAMPRKRRHVVGTLAAVVAVAIVLATSFLGNFGTDVPRMDTQQRSQVLSQVEPATLSREAVCLSVEGSLAPRVEGASYGLVSYSSEAEIVALNSSSDPVLAAFGRAVLDGTVSDDYRFFNMARLYCRAD